MRIFNMFATALLAYTQYGAAQPAQYTITDLGLLDSPGSSVATHINDNGDVSGYAYFHLVGQAYREQHAMLWPAPDGAMQDLGTMGSITASAWGINNRGLVAGFGMVDGRNRAFVWQNGAMQELSALSSGASYALAINDNGIVATHCTTAGGTDHPCIWDADGNVTDLMAGLDSPYTDVLNGVAWAVNSNGAVAGMTEIPQGAHPNHAYLWQDGVLTYLGTLGGPISYGYSLNDLNVVVGRSDVTGGQHAFRWDAAGA